MSKHAKLVEQSFALDKCELLFLLLLLSHTRLSKAGLLGLLRSSQVWVLTLSVAAESRLNAISPIFLHRVMELCW